MWRGGGSGSRSPCHFLLLQLRPYQRYTDCSKASDACTRVWNWDFLTTWLDAGFW